MIRAKDKSCPISAPLTNAKKTPKQTQFLEVCQMICDVLSPRKQALTSDLLLGKLKACWESVSNSINLLRGSTWKHELFHVCLLSWKKLNQEPVAISHINLPGKLKSAGRYRLKCLNNQLQGRASLEHCFPPCNNAP